MMKALWRSTAFCLLTASFFFSSVTVAHPGRTDANGGHTCRTNCEKWGLEYGEYHYHNGKGNSSSGSQKSSTPSTPAKSSPAPAPAASKKPVNQEEVIPAGMIKVDMPGYKVVVNHQEINNAAAEYPVLQYKQITYFPMTWNYTRALSLDTAWDSQTGFSIRKGDLPPSLPAEDAAGPAPGKLYAKLPDYPVYVNDTWVDNSKEEYPLLVYNNITYFPMTWGFAVEQLGLTIDFQNNTFTISKEPEAS